MSGHSHWATIRRKKGAVDAKKGQMFSKLARAIMLAARQGGGDASTNIQLKYAFDKAREAGMPKDNIERAVKKGTGELDGGSLDTAQYEAIAHGGVFILIDVLTDNKNRSSSEIRKILEMRGARLGSVAWAFDKKGSVSVPLSAGTEDQIMELAIELGAEDVQTQEKVYQITCSVSAMEQIRRGLEGKNIAVESCELIQVAKTPVAVDATAGRKLVDLLSELEEHDDVQSVYSNMEMSPEALAEMARMEE